MTKQFRQGDVLLVKVDALPDGAVPQKIDDRIVLAYGEVTGHAHAVPIDGAVLYKSNGEDLLKVHTATALVHEEHSPIALDPGVYKVVRQREYTPQEIRRVQTRIFTSFKAGK